ncbi:MAG: TIGR02281 family clan AA aspartic protease [Pseudomonadota bacterium]
MNTQLVLITAGISAMFIATFLRAIYGARSRAVSAVAWTLAAAAVGAAYTYRDEGRLLFQTITGQGVPIMVAEEAPPGRTELRRAWDGHYRAIADINGAAVGLLIDTGASLVLLRHEDAVRAGVDIEALDYHVPVTTANGRARIAPIDLAEIRIGSVEIRDVRGAVARPGQLHTSLLGMSFIERLEETTIRGDRIIMQQ